MPSRERNGKGKNSAEQGDRLGDGRDRNGTGKNTAGLGRDRIVNGNIGLGTAERGMGKERTVQNRETG